MSKIATYTFLPWLRQGLVNRITGQSDQRATIPVELTLKGRKVGSEGIETRPAVKLEIELYGPGDIVGLDERAIVKTEPNNRITNFEPNYLPYIDFYDEDLPWRYSPTTPQGHRLVPWMMLIVLKDGEFKDGKNISDRPLPYLLTTAATRLLPSSQFWAWAHVHVNKNLIASSFRSTDSATIQAMLETELNTNPDIAYSRIICPRRLAANTSYHAFLVPTFESGRLAGLGQDPSDAASFDALAWTDAAIPAEIPFYHRWFFRTGETGDFEFLVRLLEPQPIDSRVGLRDMDVQKPGANVRGIVDLPGADETESLGGILKLGGALRIPNRFYTPEELAVVGKFDRWATLNGLRPYPHPFQSDLAAFVNLTDSYQENTARDANANAAITEDRPADDPEIEFDIGQNSDPLITAPLYGRWHALTKRLLKDRQGGDVNPNDNWVHELNLDPRWRSAAGFGTAVVQDNQEDYMTAAWEQVGEIVESNKKIKYAQLAKEVSYSWYNTYLKPAAETQPSQWLALSAPLHSRVLTEMPLVPGSTGPPRRTTVRYQIAGSRVPMAALSTGMRKQLRPRGRLAKRLPFDEEVRPTNLIDRINKDDVSAAPPREKPPSLNGHQAVADIAKPSGVPGFLERLLNRFAWLRWLPLILALILLLLLVGASTSLWIAGIAAVGGLFGLFRLLTTWRRELVRAQSVLPENQMPESVDNWPSSPDFRISIGADPFRPSFGATDSDEAVRFKTALKNVFTLVQTSLAASVPVVKPALDITLTGSQLYLALNPEITIPRWLWAGVIIPRRIRDQLLETFVEAMAYPEIDLPMYKPLAERSSDLFLPNINHIAQNSISLLETNQNFIESYMVGLNHEFARELLWREYPTDQRGSCFRQFWEASAYHHDKHLNSEALKEKLRDIPPLHLWSRFSNLGDHDHRETEGDKEEEAVLVIRGELLKKYPNAVIYAQRAVWKDEEGKPIVYTSGSQAIDPSKERDLRPLTPIEQANPPRTLLKTPLYEARVDPDIHFFGFDLTVCEAIGGTGKESETVAESCAREGITWDDPGWFFIIKERPGEPRFGLDIGDETNVDEQGRIEVWNDLGWQDVTPAVASGGFIQITDQTQTITANQPLELPEDAEKQEQQEEDKALTWSKDMSSAELAHLLYQVPVLVAVHAAEMLPRQ